VQVLQKILLECLEIPFHQIIRLTIHFSVISILNLVILWQDFPKVFSTIFCSWQLRLIYFCSFIFFKFYQNIYSVSPVNLKEIMKPIHWIQLDCYYQTIYLPSICPSCFMRVFSQMKRLQLLDFPHHLGWLCWNVENLHCLLLHVLLDSPYHLSTLILTLFQNDMCFMQFTGCDCYYKLAF
jgi:hypothetical protein